MRVRKIYTSGGLSVLDYSWNKSGFPSPLAIEKLFSLREVWETFVFGVEKQAEAAIVSSARSFEVACHLSRAAEGSYILRLFIDISWSLQRTY